MRDDHQLRELQQEMKQDIIQTSGPFLRKLGMTDEDMERFADRMTSLKALRTAARVMEKELSAIRRKAHREKLRTIREEMNRAPWWKFWSK